VLESLTSGIVKVFSLNFFHATCHYCERNFVFLKLILHYSDLRRRAYRQRDIEGRTDISTTWHFEYKLQDHVWRLWLTMLIEEGNVWRWKNAAGLPYSWSLDYSSCLATGLSYFPIGQAVTESSLILNSQSPTKKVPKLNDSFYRAMLPRVRVNCHGELSVRPSISLCQSVTLRYRGQWSYMLEFL